MRQNKQNIKRLHIICYDFLQYSKFVINVNVIQFYNKLTPSKYLRTASQNCGYRAIKDCL